jgi:hypothetical protein
MLLFLSTLLTPDFTALSQDLDLAQLPPSPFSLTIPQPLTSKSIESLRRWGLMIILGIPGIILSLFLIKSTNSQKPTILGQTRTMTVPVISI